MFVLGFCAGCGGAPDVPQPEAKGEPATCSMNALYLRPPPTAWGPRARPQDMMFAASPAGAGGGLGVRVKTLVRHPPNRLFTSYVTKSESVTAAQPSPDMVQGRSFLQQCVLDGGRAVTMTRTAGERGDLVVTGPAGNVLRTIAAEDGAIAIVPLRGGRPAAAIIDGAKLVLADVEGSPREEWARPLADDVLARPGLAAVPLFDGRASLAFATKGGTIAILEVTPDGVVARREDMPLDAIAEVAMTINSAGLADVFAIAGDDRSIYALQGGAGNVHEAPKRMWEGPARNLKTVAGDKQRPSSAHTFAVLESDPRYLLHMKEIQGGIWSQGWISLVGQPGQDRAVRADAYAVARLGDSVVLAYSTEEPRTYWAVEGAAADPTGWRTWEGPHPLARNEVYSQAPHLPEVQPCGGEGQRACCVHERLSSCDPPLREAVTGQLTPSLKMCDWKAEKGYPDPLCKCADVGASRGVCVRSHADLVGSCWFGDPAPAAADMSLYVTGLNHAGLDTHLAVDQIGVAQLLVAIGQTASSPDNIVVALSASHARASKPGFDCRGQSTSGACLAKGLEDLYKKPFRYTAWNWFGAFGAAVITGPRWEAVPREVSGRPSTDGSALEVILVDQRDKTTRVPLYVFHATDFDCAGRDLEDVLTDVPMRRDHLAPLFVGDFNASISHPITSAFFQEAFTWHNVQNSCKDAETGRALQFRMEGQIIHILAGKRGGPRSFACSSGHLAPLNLKYSRTPEGDARSAVDGIRLDDIAHNVVAMDFAVVKEPPADCQAPLQIHHGSVLAVGSSANPALQLTTLDGKKLTVTGELVGDIRSFEGGNLLEIQGHPEPGGTGTIGVLRAVRFHVVELAGGDKPLFGTVRVDGGNVSLDTYCGQKLGLEANETAKKLLDRPGQRVWVVGKPVEGGLYRIWRAGFKGVKTP